MIRVTIVLAWVIIGLAGMGVGRFYDLVVQGWEALAALLAIMVGGKTMERVKELTGKAAVAVATAAPAAAAAPCEEDLP